MLVSGEGRSSQWLMKLNDCMVKVMSKQESLLYIYVYVYVVGPRYVLFMSEPKLYFFASRLLLYFTVIYL